MSDITRTKTDDVKDKQRRHMAVIVKVVCVLVAFVMWIYVMMVESPEYEETFSHITVELINADRLIEEKELAIYNGYGTMIDITLSGKKSVISKLSPADLVATADVSTVTGEGGRYNCKITVDVPAGCKVVGMSQETVSVYLDKSEQINLILGETRENTDLPEGAFTGTVEYPVDMVTVTGPANVISRVNRAVAKLDLSGVRKTTTLTSAIVLLDREGNEISSPYIDYYPKQVTVTVPVYKTVTVNLDVHFRYGFLGYDNTNVSISPATVEVTGEVDTINKGNLIKSIVLDEKNDFDKFRCKDTFVLEAVDGVFLSASEVEVTAIIDSKQISSRTITVPGNNIMDTGARPGVEYTYDRSATQIELMGPPEALAAIDPEDIILILDMSPYSESNSGSSNVKAEIVIDSPYKDDVLELGVYEIKVVFNN